MPTRLGYLGDGPKQTVCQALTRRIRASKSSHLASLPCYIRNVANRDLPATGLSGLSIGSRLARWSILTLAVVASPSVMAEGVDPSSQSTVPANSGQPSAEEMTAAKQHFDSGARFFQDGNYTAARAEFEAAYALSKLTPLLYNLARAAEKQGQRDDALRYYEKYLATNPADAEEVRKHLAELKQADPTASPSTASPPLDGGPGWLKGYPKLPPIPAIVTLGAGVAFLAIGIGTGVSALSIQKDVASASNRYWTGDISTLYDKGKTLNNTAIAFDVLGGIALAGGAAWTGYWIYLRGKQPNNAAPPPVPPTARILPTGNGLAVVGSF